MGTAPFRIVKISLPNDDHSYMVVHDKETSDNLIALSPEDHLDGQGFQNHAAIIAAAPLMEELYKQLKGYETFLTNPQRELLSRVQAILETPFEELVEYY